MSLNNYSDPLDYEAMGENVGERSNAQLLICLLSSSDDLGTLATTDSDRLVYVWPYLFPFQLNIKKYLLVSMPLWAKHVSDEQIQGFVENLMVAVFKPASQPCHPEMCPSALQGLSQAMKLPSPSHHLWSLLCDATGRIFDLLPNRIRVKNKNIYIPDSLCLGFFKVSLAKAGWGCFKNMGGRASKK